MTASVDATTTPLKGIRRTAARRMVAAWEAWSRASRSTSVTEHPSVRIDAQPASIDGILNIKGVIEVSEETENDEEDSGLTGRSDHPGHAVAPLPPTRRPR